MKRFKTKLTTLLVAISCFVACFGFGVFEMGQSSQTNLVAAAETAKIATKEYNLGGLHFQMLQPGGENDNMAYFKRADGQAFPAIADTNTLWEAPFRYAKGAVTINGKNVSPTVKFPDAAFFEFSSVPKTGDVLVIGGDFYNDTFGVKYTIAPSTFEWDGSTWKIVKGIAVTYTTSAGTVTDYAKIGEAYTLTEGKTFNTFIAWVSSGQLYKAGDIIEVSDPMSFEALELDFNLVDGASIRVTSLVEFSGIRFTTMINADDLATLKQNGIEVVEYGTLITPYDYLAAGQTPNLEDFTPDTDILKIPSTKSETVDGHIVFRGAMQDLNEENYDRLFAGCGYIKLAINGETATYYTPFDKKDNVRSIYAIANAFIEDDSDTSNGELRYSELSETRKEIVHDYASLGEIKLMDYAQYAANNVFEVVAWNYPLLNPENNYDNQDNRDIADDMIAAGIKVVNLTGKSLGEALMDNDENVEKTRSIIHFFWSQGLKTIAFMGVNAGKVDHVAVDYFTTTGMPDFSDCPGFIGFLFWDEPNYNSDGTILDGIVEKFVNLAEQFDTLYAGTGVAYINNLYPSYASGITNTATYKKYVEDYCKNVLEGVEGEKWLSVDSYPIKQDKTLDEAFLFDLGVIKTYALQYGAKSHVALQSSGWGSSSNSDKSRIPTEQEMRMQAYAAMAFGIDVISWFTYSPSYSDTETFYTFVDENGNITDQTAYNAFKTVNSELGAIGAVYGALEWKGVILGIGKDNSTSGFFGVGKKTDHDYKAYNRVNGQLSIDGKNYQLSESNTKNLSSVSSNKGGAGKDFNYLVGVMEDMNGNEGYVLCNYNAIEEDRGQTLTLTFKTNVTKAVVYRGGVKTEVDVSNKTLSIALGNGEGLIVLPSKLG